MSASILVIGLNHSTAPVQIRERITFPGNEDGAVARSLLQVHGVEEAMILSTCNRAEIIAVTDTAETVSPRLIEEIANIHGLDPEPFRGFLYLKEGPEAVQHVFRVASSLDSMVLGEPQILGQVKEGYKTGRNFQRDGAHVESADAPCFFCRKTREIGDGNRNGGRLRRLCGGGTREEDTWRPE